MDIWSTLQIERTTDKRTIKKAYARLAAKYHPEEHPEEFQRIYAAYEEALKYAERGGYTSYRTDVSFSTSDENLEKPVHKKQQSDIDFERLVTPETGRHLPENESSEKNGEDIDFEQLIQPETRKGLFVKSRDDELDFSALSNVDRDDTSAAEIDTLIGRFRVIIYDRTMRVDTRAWERLFHDESFLRLHLERDFIVKFAVMFREVQLTKTISQLIYGALDFPQLESLYEYEVYRELKENLLKDIKGKRRNVKHSDVPLNKSKGSWVIGLLVGIFILLLPGEDMNGPELFSMIQDIADGVKENSSLDKQLERYLESSYEVDFEVAAFGEPSDIMEVYYFIAEGKDVSDYQWFLVDTKNVEIPVQFYAAWSEDEGFQFDYAYRNMFAILDYVRLSDFVDDKDNYNMEYYKQGDQRYSYPVLLVEGAVVDAFCERLGRAVDLIAETKSIFDGKEDVTLNIYNPHTGGMYYLKIREGETVDKEAMKREVERIARGTGM